MDQMVKGMYVLGIDPGQTGAFVLLAPDKTIYHAMDVPTSSASKDGMDTKVVIEIFKAFSEYNPLCVLESVGGLPRQSAPAAFNFGHLCGSLYALALVHFGPVELVTPQKWKGALGLRGKRGSAKDGEWGQGRSVADEADRLFPGSEHLFRGPRGGPKVDVAEAALIALWGSRTYRG